VRSIGFCCARKKSSTLEVCVLSPPQVVKKFQNMFTCFDTIHERDKHPDGWRDTARRHRTRLCIAPRGKKLTRELKTAGDHLIPRSRFCIMDLPSPRTGIDSSASKSMLTQDTKKYQSFLAYALAHYQT